MKTTRPRRSTILQIISVTFLWSPSQQRGHNPPTRLKHNRLHSACNVTLGRHFIEWLHGNWEPYFYSFDGILSTHRQAHFSTGRREMIGQNRWFEPVDICTWQCLKNYASPYRIRCYQRYGCSNQRFQSREINSNHSVPLLPFCDSLRYMKIHNFNMKTFIRRKKTNLKGKTWKTW